MMWNLWNEMNNATEPKERLKNAHHFIATSKLLLREVTDFESNFSINPDITSQDVRIIGNNEIYIYKTQ